VHALILAGGEGSRLRADGVATPKAFVQIGGRPLVFRLVETLRSLGCTSITAAIRRSVMEEAAALTQDAFDAGLVVVPCDTPSSLHTLARGLEAVPPGPIVCTMVDTVMRAADWQHLFARADQRLQDGADACVAVTSYVDDETPLWVTRRSDGMVRSFGAEPVTPALVTGGVYFLSSGIRDLAPRVVSLGVQRMRGFLRWLVEHGYHVATADVERIVDLDTGRDLAQAVTWLRGMSPTLPEPSA
jgi:NDP-sugar pyrophosphorylase family protein